MNKKIIRPIVLSLVFLVSVIAFSFLGNRGNEDITTTMPEASLPVLYVHYDNTKINEMKGYTNEMNSLYMRDSLTPVDESRVLPITIETFGAKVDALDYQIRSIDNERLLVEESITEFTQKGQALSAEIRVQNLLEAEVEYNVIFTLHVDGKDVYYYTRLINTTLYNAKECLAFAHKFHKNTFLPEGDSFIPTYMDAATGDATTLHYVDLSCTLKQIKWADFTGEKLTEPIASIKEINSSYNVITLQYVMTNVNEYGETEYYNVEEYYRLRLSPQRMYVLNFERRMNQIFRGENTFVFSDNDVLLGIRDPEIKYASAKNDTTLCFVQEGELWCLDRKNYEITKVFSFRGEEGIKLRENFLDHEIKIVSIDEAGSINFVVYGYMNRGEHEGEVGVGIYHYDGLAHTTEERLFIPYNKSFEVLQAELGQLSYVNDLGQLFLLLDGSVHCIDLSTQMYEVMIGDLSGEMYATSNSNRYLAWIETQEEQTSNKMYLMDLKYGKKEEISVSSSEALRPLGFIGEDFIYGIAKKSDVRTDAAGNLDFPMYCLKILNTSENSLEELKTYQPMTGYVRDIEIEDYLVHVGLMKMQNDVYVDAGEDTIMNRAADTEATVYAKQINTEVKQRQMVVYLQEEVERKTLKYITAKDVLVEEARVLDLKQEENNLEYFVYVKGSVTLATDNVSEAIIAANEGLGVVVDSNQNYVWMRARRTQVNPFHNVAANETDKMSGSVIQAISGMLRYKGYDVSVVRQMEHGLTARQVLENTLQGEKLLDLKGCTVDEILYFISKGSPVFAMTSNEDAVLLTGYNANRLYYYNPKTQTTEYWRLEDANEVFAGAGNIFFAILN